MAVSPEPRLDIPFRRRAGGVWIWREPDGWLWTTPEVWPFLWSQQSTDWLYLIENLTPPEFTTTPVAG